MKLIALFIAALACVSLGVVSPGRWSNVIVAGSSKQHVFDNATKSFQQKLEKSGLGSKRFTSDYGLIGIKDGIHTPLTTLEGIELSLTRESGPCLLYITSHGSPGGDVDVGNQVLTPAILDDILTKSCGKKQGVLIMSACYSGEYMRLQFTHPNWTILTASAADRTSFGCTNDLTYTYWDGCFLNTIDSGERTWAKIYLKTLKCVISKETDFDIPPRLRSEPMFYQGEKSPKEVPW